ncbi:MAG: glycine cleavage system aminomethyltransferase GcvT [Ruminiclostridium sp.]|nr:glycine cleavage system aminomethyltransferase GcvT [Ruminiclostridium sp.]
MKRTPLYEKHCLLGGKMIDFGGWELPVQYTGILEEHRQVRKAGGLFDVSHMGEIHVSGSDSENYIQRLITNNIVGAKEYKVIYSPLCYPDGGVVDDLLVYKYSDTDFLIIVNAGNTDKDFEWFLQNAAGKVTIENVSSQYAQLAIQGPKAETVLQKLTGSSLQALKFFTFDPNVQICTKKAIISRTGYTGEDGFEIYISPEDAGLIWDSLLEAGKDEGLIPVGLGARDTLRFEAALPLYGHEISENITPLEAGLGKFVKLDKEFFIGKDALAKQVEQGVPRKLIGFEMTERGIPRSHYEVQANGREIGFVTTGSFSPSLDKNIGLALLNSDNCSEGNEVDIIIRGKPVRAKTIGIPFYQKKYKG